MLYVAVSKNYRINNCCIPLASPRVINAESPWRHQGTNQLPQLEQLRPIARVFGAARRLNAIQQNELFLGSMWLSLMLPLSLSRAKPLFYEKDIPDQMYGWSLKVAIIVVWFALYSTFSDARKDLAQVRKVSGYSEAFIRMVDKSQTSGHSLSLQKPAEPKWLLQGACKPNQ